MAPSFRYRNRAALIDLEREAGKPLLHNTVECLRRIVVDVGKATGAAYRIREFRRSDFRTLWEIDQECFPPGISYSELELLTYMRRLRSFTLVAEQETSPDGISDPQQCKAVGFIVAEAGRRQNGHIITIDVLEEARRSGLGSMLLKAAEDRLRESGCHAVFLETAVDNSGALAFYKQHGYFLVKTEPGYYSTGVDAFVLRKDLATPGASE